MRPRDPSDAGNGLIIYYSISQVQWTEVFQTVVGDRIPWCLENLARGECEDRAWEAEHLACIQSRSKGMIRYRCVCRGHLNEYVGRPGSSVYTGGFDPRG